jgi:phage regulator Rha-like protein
MKIKRSRIFALNSISVFVNLMQAFEKMRKSLNSQQKQKRNALGINSLIRRQRITA